MPFLKNVIGSPLAFGLNFSLGTGINEFLSNGKIEATEQESQSILEKHKNQTEMVVKEFRSK